MLRTINLTDAYLYDHKLREESKQQYQMVQKNGYLTLEKIEESEEGPHVIVLTEQSISAHISTPTMVVNSSQLIPMEPKNGGKWLPMIGLTLHQQLMRME